MSKKKRQTHRRLARNLVSVFILLIVLLPSLLTVKWLMEIFGSSDPRQVVSAQPFEARLIDKKDQPVTPFHEPIVTITFDDGWESVYTKAFPTLQKYGLHTTQYIISGALEDYGYMSAAQLRSMQQSGHEIGAHTVSHADLTTLDDKQLTHELADAKTTLENEFGPIRDFTSPYGAYNQHTLQMISKYYRSQKNAEGDPTTNDDGTVNVPENFDMLNITSYSIRQSTKPSDLQKLLNEARESNGWLVLTYHQIDYSGEQFSVTPEVFAQQMAMISASNMRSATVGQVLDILAPNKPLEF